MNKNSPKLVPKHKVIEKIQILSIEPIKLNKKVNESIETLKKAIEPNKT